MAQKIVERALDYGIPRSDVLIDPLVMPIGAMASAGRSVFRILNRCRDELGVNTCCGASNVSFGLPNRPVLNGTFLAMAISNGLTSAITNAIEHEIKRGIQAADVFMGHDANCLTWIQTNRQPGVPGKEADQRRERRERRPRRE
jgi:5-methyltetrahydrofolate--homocysteine methyltransferase